MTDKMTAAPGRTLRDSAAMRWTALAVVAFTMMAAYYVNDVMAPLQEMLEEQLGWSGSEFGFFTGAYSFLNVFLLMLIWGGFLIDRFGVRFTGKLAVLLMAGGTLVQYYGITALAGNEELIFGYKTGVFVAAAGYSVFGVGAEVAGITVTKIIARWFKGKELATAMGVQVALARIGSQAAYSLAIPLARNFQLETPVLIGLVLLVGGAVSFFIFSVMDRRLDRQEGAMESAGADDEKFSFRDVAGIVKNRGFWLIALLCVLFYACVFPFQKFASAMMVSKYGIDPDFAGSIVGLPAMGALFLTPVFGGVIDRRGRSASMMILGSGMLIFVHFLYAMPFVDQWWVAVALMVILGIAFSLVPSALWPAVAKIFPVSQLGTAYALIFFIQNIGLWGVPNLIGTIQEHYCVIGRTPQGASIYDYTLPMLVFCGFAVLSVAVSILLKKADRRYGYGLELPNIKK